MADPYDIVNKWETMEPWRFCPSVSRRGNPPDERKEGDGMITYQELFLFCTFIVSLISLLYQIFKGKK